MKLGKTMKKGFAVVLSLAMVGTSVTVSNTAMADAASRAETIALIQSETSNLALGRNVTVLPNMQPNEGGANGDGVKLITDGDVTGSHIATAFNTADTSFVIDLGKTYSAEGIEQIAVQYKEKNTGDTPVKGYQIQYSDNGIDYYDVKTVEAQADADNPTWAEEGQENLDVQDVTAEEGKAVQYVKLSYPDGYAWGIQVREIAVLDTDGDVTEATVEKCDDAESVTVKSEDYNSITYNITAKEGQVEAGYKYIVYLDGVTQIGSQVDAGTDYTVTNVSGGVHTVKVVAYYDGKVSAGITSEEVEVTDVSAVVTGTRNLTNVNNNADAKVTSVSEFYDENFSLETSGVVFDGLIPTGEGNSVALRTKGTPAEVVIDLGANYTPAQFEQVILAYSNPRTYAATTAIAFSTDDTEYIEVGGSTGYECKKDGGGVADLNVVPLDAEKLAAYGKNYVRYIKITLSEGQFGWGYVVNEISVILDRDVSKAEIYVEGKSPVEVPAIADKEYTGDIVTADIADTEYYTVTENNGGVDVGTYNVTLTLKNPAEYYWSNDKTGTETTRTLTFDVTKADNEWLSGLTIESWVYGEEAKTPSAEAKHGDVVYTYSTSEDGTYEETVPENAGTYYVKAEVMETANYAGLEGVTQPFEIEKAEQVAPEGIEAVKSTLAENADGKITNVTAEMEYRADGEEEYTSIEGTEIADVLAGTYYVRYKEKENYKPSADVEVVVESGRKLAVSLTQGTGYVLEAVNTDDTEVEYGTSYEFKVAISSGYKKGSAFAVKVNGEVVEPDAEGVYTVEVTEDIEVTVEGIVEDVPAVTTPRPTTPQATTPQPTTPQKTTAPKTTTKKVLRRTTVKKASKKKASKKVSITFKKVTGAKKYQVQISTTKKFKKILVKKTVKKVKVTITSKKLKNKKKLYVRVKAVGAKRWSRVKKITIKK